MVEDQHGKIIWHFPQFRLADITMVKIVVVVQLMVSMLIQDLPL
jgi:hypothetical protein